jgi:hypothetical protein
MVSSDLSAIAKQRRHTSARENNVNRNKAFWAVIAVAVVILLSTVVFGQAMPESKGPRSVESVTFTKNAVLTWKVSGSNALYSIDLNSATMTFRGETRGFSEEEADMVVGVLGVLGHYCAESTVWWEEGQGKKMILPATRVGD